MRAPRPSRTAPRKARPAATASAAGVAAKIRLLTEQYPHAKPSHRATIAGEGAGAPAQFCAGKFINTLARHFIGEVRQRPLSKESRELLLALPWFVEWLDNLEALRRGELPSTQQEVDMLLGHCGVVDPRSNRPHELNGECGAKYAVDVRLLLQKVAPNFHAGAAVKHPLRADQIHAIRTRAWAKGWLRQSAQVRAVTDTRRVITKREKLQLVVHYYPHAKPAWEDEIPVCTHELGATPFVFRPATWIDDVTNNWVNGKGKASVVLTDEQMAGLMTLPWVAGWLEAIARRRGLY